jgi:hypothetical protein
MAEKSLEELWIEAKETEKAAEKARREIEDKLIKGLNLAEVTEGSKTIDRAAHKIKVTFRVNRKVDSEQLQKIANEAGLQTYLSTLFRWSAEISTTAWKATVKKITDKLSPAITATPGRPSFEITPKEGA